MKKLLLFSSLIALALNSIAQQGVWVQQATGSVPVSSGIRAIYAVDSMVAWTITYDGSGAALPRNDYSRTIDGGAHWTNDVIPPSTSIWDWAGMTALNADSAWVIVYNATAVSGGQIWFTPDGGTNWSQQGLNAFTNLTQSFPNNIHMFDAMNGVIVGDQVGGEYEFYTTIDGGANWVVVDTANIPDPQDADENAWTTHYSVIGDTIWFDTNEGRVYRSTDRGFHWNVASTTLTIVPPAAIDICFSSGSYGIARLYETGTGTSVLVNTTDGGLNWDTLSFTGDLFGGDIKNVPGENMMFVSTGIDATSGYTGTSYSTDGGMTWITIETGTQRGSLGISDSLHMWCGGFTASDTEGGIYKWTYYPTVPCIDPTISAGITTSSDSSICDGDTLVMTASNVVGPEDGYYSGIGWVISTADISGSNDPLAETSLFAYQRVKLPASSVNTQLFVNDATLIDGSGTAPYGPYYWTPVLFGGNATNIDVTLPYAPVDFLFNLNLDLNCVYTGTSILVYIREPQDPNCGVGVDEINASKLNVKSFMKDAGTLDVQITSEVSGKVNIQLLDLTGRLVAEVNSMVNAGVNHEIVNVSSIATGTYIVKAQVNGILATGKVVKN